MFRGPTASVSRVLGFDVENTTEVIDAVMGDRCTYPAKTDRGAISDIVPTRLIAERSATIKKPSDLLGSDGNRVTLRAIQVTPTGVENPLDSQGNIDVQHSVPLPVPLQSSILPSGLAEIVALWPALTDPQRSELLRLARAMIEGANVQM